MGGRSAGSSRTPPPRKGPGSAPLAGPDPIASGPDRITVSLIAKAAADLQRTHARTRLSKTDIINRAVSLYEFVESELGEGAELIIRRDGKDHLVKLL